MTAIPDIFIGIAVVLALVGRMIAKQQKPGNGLLEKWPEEK